MGVKGAVPKRTDQLHGHRKPPATDKAPTPPGAASYRRPAADSTWHPLAKRWWNALSKSGQSTWYQPSDWEHAYIWAEMLSRQLFSAKPSSMMLAAWDAASVRLLVTEGDRRRMRIELDKGGEVDADKEAAVASMQAWRANRASGS
jgi:hypothetical protein